MPAIDGGYLVTRAIYCGAGCGAQHAGGVLLKLSATGDFQWAWQYREINGEWSEKLNPLAVIIPDGEGGYLAGGSSYLKLNGVGKKVGSLMRLEADGDVLWHVVVPAAGEITQLAPAGAGSYIAAGSKSVATGVEPVHVWLGRVDAAGNLMWQKTLTNACCSDDVRALVHTTDNQFVIGGASGTWPDLTAWLMKFDSNGQPAWEKRYGPALSVINHLAPAPEGGMLAVGGTHAWSSEMVVRLSSAGNVLWSQSLTGDMILHSAAPAGDGGWVVAGGPGNADQMLVAKLDVDGHTAACASLFLDWPVGESAGSGILADTAVAAISQGMDFAAVSFTATDLVPTAAGCETLPGWQTSYLPCLQR